MKRKVMLAVIILALILVSPIIFVSGVKAPDPAPTEPMESIETNETTAPTEEILIDSSEWFVTDEKPSQFTDETYPPREEAEPETTPEPTYPPENVSWYGEGRVYASGEITTEICGEGIDRDFLAKMVFAEAGGEDWWCQVYTCSAILNHCEVSNMTLWKCGHNGNHFSVASYVDGITPTEMSYEVVDYVLNGGRIEGICYFRTKRYHSFGEPMCKVGAHYFSIE